MIGLTWKPDINSFISIYHPDTYHSEDLNKPTAVRLFLLFDMALSSFTSRNWLWKPTTAKYVFFMLVSSQLMIVFNFSFHINKNNYDFSLLQSICITYTLIGLF